MPLPFDCRKSFPFASILLIEAGRDVSNDPEAQNAAGAHPVRHSDQSWHLGVTLSHLGPSKRKAYNSRRCKRPSMVVVRLMEGPGPTVRSTGASGLLH